jgi:hypothetical protein
MGVRTPEMTSFRHTSPICESILIYPFSYVPNCFNVRNAPAQVASIEFSGKSTAILL